MLKRKLFVLLAVLVTIALVLGACKGKEKNTNLESEKTSPSQQEVEEKKTDSSEENLFADDPVLDNYSEPDESTSIKTSEDADSQSTSDFSRNSEAIGSAEEEAQWTEDVILE